MDGFNVIFHAIAGTPWWVWAIFGYLLFIGLKATQERSIFLPKMFIVPAILLLMKIPQLLTSPLSSTLWFFGAFAVGLSIAWLLFLHTAIIVNRTTTSITLPGSWSLMALILVIFAVRYTFGYLDAVHPQTTKDLLPLKDAALGLISGFMWGKALSYTHKFFRSKS